MFTSELWFCSDCHHAYHGDDSNPDIYVSGEYADYSSCGDDLCPYGYDVDYCVESCGTRYFDTIPCDNGDCLEPDLAGSRHRYSYFPIS